MDNFFSPSRQNLCNHDLYIHEYSKIIPIELRSILVKLEFISMIKRGYKINTNSMNFVDADSWIGSLKRMFNHENRKNTLDFIVRTVSLSIDSIDKYQNSSYLKILINSLNTARIGIAELASTYRDDPEIVSNFKVCLANIDIQLDKYKSLIKGFDTVPFSAIQTGTQQANIQADTQPIEIKCVKGRLNDMKLETTRSNPSSPTLTPIIGSYPGSNTNMNSNKSSYTDESSNSYNFT